MLQERAFNRKYQPMSVLLVSTGSGALHSSQSLLVPLHLALHQLYEDGLSSPRLLPLHLLPPTSPNGSTAWGLLKPCVSCTQPRQRALLATGCRSIWCSLQDHYQSN